MSDDTESGGPAPAEGDLDLETGRAVLEAHDYLSWIGLELERLEPGRAVMHLPYQEKLTNWSSGAIHGGVTATAVDTCSAFALRTCVEDAMDLLLATTDLDVKYVRPATSDLYVDADVIRVGESTGVTRVTVDGETPEGERKTVAIGATTYRLFQ